MTGPPAASPARPAAGRAGRDAAAWRGVAPACTGASCCYPS